MSLIVFYFARAKVDANQPKQEQQRKFSYDALIFLFAWDLACSLETKLDFMSLLWLHWGFNFWKWDHEACLKRFQKKINMLNTTEDKTMLYLWHFWRPKVFLETPVLPNLHQIPKKIYYYPRMTASDMNIRIALRTSLGVEAYVWRFKGTDKKWKH